MHNKIHVFSGLKRTGDEHKFPSTSYIREEILLKGYCIIPDQISPNTINKCREELDTLSILEQQNFGLDNLMAINDKGVIRSPFLKSKVIREICFTGVVFDILTEIFHEQYILHVNRAVVNSPEETHPATAWHREPPYMNFTTSMPISLTFIHTIDPSTYSNGGISILHGSHSQEIFPSEEFVKLNAITPEIQEGALLVFNSALFHCGGKNISGEIRRSLVTIYTSPLLKQQVNIPQMIRDQKLEHIIDEVPRGNFTLGFDTEVQNSDFEYRNNKLKKLIQIR